MWKRACLHETPCHYLADAGDWAHFWTIAPTTGTDLTFSWTYFGALIDTVWVRATQSGYHSAWGVASRLGSGN